MLMDSGFYFKLIVHVHMFDEIIYVNEVWGTEVVLLCFDETHSSHVSNINDGAI